MMLSVAGLLNRLARAGRPQGSSTGLGDEDFPFSPNQITETHPVPSFPCHSLLSKGLKCCLPAAAGLAFNKKCKTNPISTLSQRPQALGDAPEPQARQSEWPARMFDGGSHRAGLVVVYGGKIRGIGSGAEIPPGSETIDLGAL